MRYILMAALIALFASHAHAQEVYINGSVAKKASFCIEAQDAYNLALSKDPKTDWAKMQEDGRCLAITIPWHFYRTLSEIDDLRVVELRIKLTDWQSVYAVWKGDLGFTKIEWKPEYATLPPDVQQWYREARTTPEAFKRLGWASCCEHGDVVKAKFDYNRVTEEWSYQLLGSTEWKKVPQDIIHKGSSAPYGQATLFVYNGIETCFWPPNGGV